jgi:hypothetical protein
MDSVNLHVTFVQRFTVYGAANPSSLTLLACPKNDFLGRSKVFSTNQHPQEVKGEPLAGSPYRHVVNCDKRKPHSFFSCRRPFCSSLAFVVAPPPWC